LKATVSEPSSYQRVINVEIPDEEVQKEFQVKLSKYKKEVKLPGFRPGKVPANLIKSRFGGAIRAEAIDDLVNNSYKEALTENKLTPVNEPKVSDLKAEKEGEPVSFTIEIEVDPEIEITGYKNLKTKITPKKVTDEDIDASLKALQDRMAELKEVDRPSKKGDSISFDYLDVKVDGETKEGFKPAPQMVEIGKGTLQDFDKGLEGLKKDQETVISVKFPDDYHDKAVVGKSADIIIKVKNIQEKIIPEINEEFCKKVGDFPDKKALREAIKMDHEAREESNAVAAAHDKAIDAIIQANDFEVPPSKVDFYIDKVMEDQAKYYPEGKGPSRKETEEKFRDIGIKALKRYRIIEYIANKEKVKATQEEVDTRIKVYAEQYQQPFDEIKQQLRKSGGTVKIRQEVQERKTLDTLIGKIPWESK
jgi:trigger factor